MTVRRHTARLGALATAGLLAATTITALTGPAAHAAKPKAKPATGTVASLVLEPLNSDVDYTAKVSIAGKKAKPNAAVAALSARCATSGDLAGAVTGEMARRSSLKVGGKATTLKG